MGKSFAIQLGNLMAKAGITTGKSSMRLAEQTGKAMVDAMQKLERTPEKADVVQVFEQNLPKRLRPKVITSLEEGVPYLANHFNITEQEALAYLQAQHMEASVLSNCGKKGAMYLPIEKISESLSAVVAHELEHSLESNTVKNRFVRFINPLLKKCISKKKMQDLIRLDISSDKLEAGIVNLPLKEGINCSYSAMLDCNPSKDKIYELLHSSPESLSTDLQKVLRDIVNCEKSGKDNYKLYYLFSGVVKDEVPAYTVGGHVHEYIAGSGKTSVQTIRALLYEEMSKIIKKDKKAYLRNALRGKLKPRYRSEKDLFALAKNEQEREFLEKRMPKLSEKRKASTYENIQLKPDYLECLMTKINDSNFKTVVNMKTPEGKKIFDGAAQEALGQASTERLEEFAKIVEEQTADGIHKYIGLATAINNPRFDLVKKIADIEINGKNPYTSIIEHMYLFNAGETEKMYELVSSAANDGKIVTEELVSQINRKILSTNTEERIRLLLGC